MRHARRGGVCGERACCGYGQLVCRRRARTQRCAWFLTATGVEERPAAIGAVVVATIPFGCHICHIMRWALVDDGELVRLLVGSYRG
eukprot:scaffold25934_cov56-Phaeocystis_antarctica.AAC.3